MADGLGKPVIRGASLPPLREGAHRGPSESTVAVLTEIWERVLGRAPIDPETNFFDLGGDSFLALQLLAEIEAALGRELPADLSFEAATIASMARALDAVDTQCPSALVLMKAGREQPPLFVIPGAIGSLFQLAPLAANIRPIIPIYGIRPRGLDDTIAPLERIEDMALHATREIEHVVKNGPLLLMGYSAGGLIAFEVARRLSAAGANIPLVVLLDSYPGETAWPIGSRLSVLGRRIVYRISELRDYRPAEMGPYIAERFRALLDYLSRSGFGPSTWRRGAPASVLPAVRQLYDATIAAEAAYRPSYYSGKVIFIQPSEIGLEPRDPRRVWGKFVREFEIHRVPGTHLQMIGPYVEDLAAEISACLESVLAEA